MSVSYPSTEWTRVCKVSDIRTRFHCQVKDRYITIIKSESGTDSFHCIDSICFHMGGPLGAGDVEDVAGHSCIVCPWHYLKIDISDGKKLTRKILRFDDQGKPVDFAWEKSDKVFQRVHPLLIFEDFIFIKLSDTPTSVDSDRYCYHSSAAKGLHANLKSFGSDGKCPRYYLTL